MIYRIDYRSLVPAADSRLPRMSLRRGLGKVPRSMAADEYLNRTATTERTVLIVYGISRTKTKKERARTISSTTVDVIGRKFFATCLGVKSTLGP